MVHHLGNSQKERRRHRGKGRKAMSRLIKDCLPELQEKANAFAVAMVNAGITFMFTCTKRTQAEQDALYAQGRTKPGRKVTWTRKSKHIDGKAFEIEIIKNGEPCWDTKVSVDGDAIPDYEEAGKIGESLGLRWGGRFKNSKGKPIPDYPHFEIA